MRLKTFRAFTLAEALDAVHEDLGTEAAILHTRTFKRGGFLGLGGREVVEVIASEQRPETTILPAVAGTPAAERTAADDAGRRERDGSETTASPGAIGGTAARARAAYGSAGLPRTGPRHDERHAGSDPSDRVDADDAAPVTSGSLEVDRDRTRKLAQAMAIRLERQQAAREAAGVRGPDDVIGGGAEEVTASREAEEFDVTVEATAESRLAPASFVREQPERYVIGPGGVLLPEGDGSTAGLASDGPSGTSSDSTPTVAVNSMPASPSAAPRVVALDAEHLVADPGTGLPTNSATQPPAVTEPQVESTGNRTRKASVGGELEAIRRTVGRVLGDAGAPMIEDVDAAAAVDARIDGEGSDVISSRGPDPLASAYASLVAQELSRDLADRVISSIESRLDGDARRDPSRVRDAMLAELADLVPTEESLEATRPRDGRPRTIVFVGPTGVGKTTTLAKIAATLVLRDKLRVALVTADTYRISAVDQLRTYADILGTKIEVAGDATAMRDAIDRCGDVDAILVDTPGRSQNDADRLAELRAIVDAARPHETHLVLSGTASERVLLREAEAFSSLGPDRVVITKLDEAVAFGMLVSVVRRIGRRISWVTTGQEVPRDIERATGSRLADLVLGGAVRS